MARRKRTKHAVIEEAVRLHVGADPYAVLWQNPVGIAHHRTRAACICPHCRGTGVVDPRGTYTVSYGLCVGSADLIGVVGPQGRFLAIEIKPPGAYPTPEQRRFLALVRRMGGVSGVAHNEDEAAALVVEARS